MIDVYHDEIMQLFLNNYLYLLNNQTTLSYLLKHNRIIYIFIISYGRPYPETYF